MESLSTLKLPLPLASSLALALVPPRASTPAVVEHTPVFTELQRHAAQGEALQNDDVVFDIKGNSYRLFAQIKYGPLHLVFVRFVGTHAEYDRIDARKV